MALTSNDNGNDQRLGERVTARVEDLRDRTAGVLSTEESLAYRELTRVRHRLADVEERLSDQLTVLGRQQAELAHELHRSSRRTTFPRKLFWLLVGGAAAAVGTWLADPDRGRARRSRLADQVAARARDVGDEAKGRAEQAVDRARGALIETGKGVLPEDVPDDPEVLRQRIRSQVLGYRDDVKDVVVAIGEPGEVRLKGTVRSATIEQELLDAVAEVNGVKRVDSDLTVATTTS